MMAIMIAAITGFTTVILAVVRLAEAIHELKKYPEMDTLGEILQVLKNFFTLETYGKGN